MFGLRRRVMSSQAVYTCRIGEVEKAKLDFVTAVGNGFCGGTTRAGFRSALMDGPRMPGCLCFCCYSPIFYPIFRRDLANPCPDCLR